MTSNPSTPCTHSVANATLVLRSQDQSETGNVSEPMSQLPRADAPRTLVSLFDTALYPIRQGIMSHLDTKDILNLLKTCWTMRHNIKANEWDINDRLSRFLDSPTAFRSQLGRSNALISGSFALQFFERVVWPDSDLDIMVQEGEDLERMAKHLIESEGYKMVSENDFTNPNFGAELGYATCSAETKKCQTYLYSGAGQGNGKSRKTNRSKVQLIATEGPPVQAILLGYYTTAVVNFISWNKAYALFPRATFLFHETVPLKVLNDYFGRLHSKYSTRGWRMRTEAVIDWDENGENAVEPLGFRLASGNDALGILKNEGDRRIGDANTWTMRLDSISVEASSVPDYVLEYSCFNIRGLHGNYSNLDSWDSLRRSFSLQIAAGHFRAPSLRFHYTYGNFGHFWGRFADVLFKNVCGQLCRMDQSKVQQLLGDVPPRNIHLTWEKLFKVDGWEYYDHVIPQLYDAWESGQYILR